MILDKKLARTIAATVVSALGLMIASCSPSFAEEHARETPETLSLTMAPELDTIPYELAHYSEGMILIYEKGPGPGIRSERLFGYADAKGNVVAEPQFVFASRFKNGFAIVTNMEVSGDKRTLKTRLLDTTGAFIEGAEFDSVGPFHEGFATVTVNKRWGYLNDKGEIAIAPKFRAAGRFSEGLAVVGGEDGRAYVIDTTGQKQFEVEASSRDFFSDGLLLNSSSYVDASGEKVIDLRKVDDQQGDIVLKYESFADGRAKIESRPSSMDQFSSMFENLPCGYLDKAGAVKIALNYNICGDFRGGLAAVANITDEDSKTASWQIIDTDGNNALGRTFSSIRSSFGDRWKPYRGYWPHPRDDHWIVEDADRRKGVVSANGDFIPPKYKRFGPMTHGLFGVKTDDGWGVVNSEGKFLHEPEFDRISVYLDGRALVKINNKWGYLSEP